MTRFSLVVFIKILKYSQSTLTTSYNSYSFSSRQQQAECKQQAWPVSAMLAFRLTSPGSGEDFHACRCGVGRGAEDTAEAEATGGPGWGVLMGGIGEDSFG